MRCRRCRKRLPKLAVVHADPFCSNRCCRLAHGVTGSKEDQKRTCAGCGCPHDEFSRGCEVCGARLLARERRVAA